MITTYLQLFAVIISSDTLESLVRVSEYCDSPLIRYPRQQEAAADGLRSSAVSGAECV